LGKNKSKKHTKKANKHLTKRQKRYSIVCRTRKEPPGQTSREGKKEKQDGKKKRRKRGAKKISRTDEQPPREEPFKI
jgi:hypothetical protein